MRTYLNIFPILLLITSTWGDGNDIIYSNNTDYKISFEDISQILSLELSTIRSVNPQYAHEFDDLTGVAPKKELIVTKHIAMGFCHYQVKKGDVLAQLIRKYSYRAPYSINLMSMLEKINMFNLDRIEVGQTLNLPFFFLKNSIQKSPGFISCEKLQKMENKEVMVVKGREAILKKEKDKIYFFPGYTVSEIYSSKKPVRKFYLVNFVKDMGEKSRTVATVSVNKKRAKDSFIKQSSVEVDVGGSYESILPEIRGQLVSDITPLLNLKWNQFWSENIYSFLGADLEYLRYKKNVSSRTVLEKRNTFTNQFKLGFGYRWRPLTFAQLQLAYGDFVVYRQSRENIYELASVTTTEVQLSLGKELYQKGQLSLGAMALVENNFGGNDGDINFDGGMGYGGALDIRRELGEKFNLKGTVLYKQGYYEVFGEKFKKRTFKFSAGFGYDF